MEEITQEITKETKLKRPIWKVLRIWGVLACALLVVGSGITATVLGLMHVSYGMEVDGVRMNLSQISSISVWSNQDTRHILYTDERGIKSEDLNVREIMHLLERGSRTSRFNQIFHQAGAPRISNNTTSNVNTFNIQNYTNFLFLRIDFLVPHFGIATNFDPENPTRQIGFELSRHDDERIQHNRQIRQVFIPLGNQTNRFQQQTWFINTQPSPNDNIMWRFHTWGNYYRLAQFAAELSLI